MHPLVPEFILQNYADGKTEGAFQSVGLFVDISGFSRMTDSLMEHGQHGAEIMANVMRAVFRPLIHSVCQQGGFVFAQAGDSFCAHIPVEGDTGQAVLRALSAAWTIQSVTAANPSFDTPYGSFTITVKVGMALGGTSWGIITSADEQRAAYYFQGPAVDISAQAESLAQAGEIIVNDDIYAHAQALGQFEAVDAFYRLTQFEAPCAPPLEYALPQVNLDLAQRFFPLDLYLQRQSGEFRYCTYLFVRLPTVRTEAQLRIFMQTIFELQDQYGGLLELRFGDKGAHLMLIWGAPVSYENDIERALNFIYELQARTTIPINAGVTYRMAHAGFVGSEMAEEFTAFGRGANLAARFMTAAQRGEIWVDENVARMADRYFEFENGGQQRFKGFAQPQKVFILVERRERYENEYGGQLIGRQAEMLRLEELTAPIFQANFGGVVLVKGEPGIGKSRLVHEFISSFASQHPGSFQVFRAQTDEIIRQPFNPLRYWLREYFDISDSQSEARLKRSFNRKLDDLIGGIEDRHLADELDRTRSFLGALVGLFWPDSLYEQLAARERYENTIIALNSLLQVESLRRPVILFIEDVHWLDEDSRAYLSALGRAMTADPSRQYPLVLLATTRSEYDETLCLHCPLTEILLTQLDRPTVARLVSSLLPAPPSDSLVDLLLERSEGNPLFVEEMVHYLEQNNLVDCQPDGCLVLVDNTVTFPASIQSLLVARLDYLRPAEKEIVQTAAVLGREFDMNLLSHMLSDPQDLGQRALVIEQAEFWIPLSEQRSIFRHTLMREAAYSMLIVARRRELHQRALDAIEQEYYNNLHSHYGELAHHADNAGLTEKARVYYRRAGEEAHKGYQNLLAIEYLSQALRLTPEDALDERFELLYRRSRLYDRIGSSEPRKADLETLRALAEQSEDPARKLKYQLEQANYELDVDAYELAIESAGAAIELARQLNDPAAISNGYRYTGTTYFRMGQYERAAENLQTALNYARDLTPNVRAKVLNNLGLMYLEQEMLDIASRSFSEAYESVRGSEYLILQATYMNNLAQAIGLQGDFSQSKGYFQEALDIIRKVGSRRDEGLVLGNLGWIAANLGDYQEAYRYHLQNLHTSREIGHRLVEGYAMINLSAVAIGLGNYAEAIEWGQRALALNKEINHTSGEAWAHTYIGHALLAEGRLEEAELAYRSAVSIRSELKQSVLAAEPQAGMALAAYLRGSPDQAFVHLEPLLALLDEGCLFEGAEEPLRIYFTCFTVLSALADPRAGNVLEQGYAILKARAAKILDESTRARFLEEIPHHRAILEAWESKNRRAAAAPV